MFDGQYIHASFGTPVVIDGPWFGRKGDMIDYTVDIADVLNATISVALIHKNTEDTGNGAATGSTIAATSTIGRTDQEFTSGLKEMVRYRFTVVCEDEVPGLGWILFRMLPPVWFDSLKG